MSEIKKCVKCGGKLIAANRLVARNTRLLVGVFLAKVLETLPKG